MPSLGELAKVSVVQLFTGRAAVQFQLFPSGISLTDTAVLLCKPPLKQ